MPVPALNFKKIKDYADWKLLIFLTLFLNIKLPVKLAALVIILLLQFNFRFGFRLKNSRLPLFYLLIIPVGIISLLVNHSYAQPHYLMVFFTGIGFWLLSILAVHQVKLIAEQNTVEVIDRTLVLFFILNAVLSLFNLAYIMWQTGSINPYTFRGMHQLYFINTGDHISGISFDISSTNAVLCGFGVIYFLNRSNAIMLLVCMVTMLLTYSNLITLMLLGILFGLLLFKSTRNQKSMIVMCMALFVLFMAKISPENKDYVDNTILHAIGIKTPAPIPEWKLPPRKRITEIPDAFLTPEQKRQKTAQRYLDSVSYISVQRHLKQGNTLKPAYTIPQARKINPYAAEFQEDTTADADRRTLLNFIQRHQAQMPISSQKNYQAFLPGKLTGMIQTYNYLHGRPAQLLLGTGIGNFSSKIAFRATGLGLRGRYPQGKSYINPAFLRNHLDLYIYYFSKEVGLHSVSNNPFSVYDQLLAEYGITGLLVLMIFYLGFFARQYRRLTYGVPLLLFTAGIFFIDYWFEQLSVMVMFELLMFLDLKPRIQTGTTTPETKHQEKPDEMLLEYAC